MLQIKNKILRAEKEGIVERKTLSDYFLLRRSLLHFHFLLSSKALHSFPHHFRFSSFPHLIVIVSCLLSLHIHSMKMKISKCSNSNMSSNGRITLKHEHNLSMKMFILNSNAVSERKYWKFQY